MFSRLAPRKRFEEEILLVRRAYLLPGDTNMLNIQALLDEPRALHDENSYVKPTFYHTKRPVRHSRNPADGMGVTRYSDLLSSGYSLAAECAFAKDDSWE
jgi:hypothetical protein